MLTTIVFLFGIVLFVLLAFLSLFCIRKIPLGKAGVRVGLGGYVISDTWLFCIPLVTRFELMDISIQKLEIERKRQDGLLCQDNIRVDIVVAFYLKVNYPKMDFQAGVDPDSLEGQDMAKMSRSQAKYEDILKVAQTVGCERTADPEKLRELFEGRFSEALKTVTKGMEFQTLHDERLAFREKSLLLLARICTAMRWRMWPLIIWNRRLSNIWTRTTYSTPKASRKSK